MLQRTIGDPSWMIFRAHGFLPLPGTQGTNIQVNCLSSPTENAGVHISTDKSELMVHWVPVLLLAELAECEHTAGQSRDVLTETEVVSALPGTDVTLVCLFPKSRTTHIIQTQWSKTEDNQSTKIAVYHPIYGTHYFKFSEASYNFSVSFSTRKCCNQDVTESLCSINPNIPPECNQWALHLKNVTIALSGQYKCSFATYPYGTKAAKIQLIVKAEVKKSVCSLNKRLVSIGFQSTMNIMFLIFLLGLFVVVTMIKEEQHYLKKVWLNQTLEIPCLEDTISEDLSIYPLKWLVGDNDRKEELVTKEPSCPAVYRNSSSVYGQRVRLGLNNTLKVFPTKITDDGRVFSCHVMYHPERVQKSSTTVRVYGNEEMNFYVLAVRSILKGLGQNLEIPSVSCVVRKAFPKPSLVWYVDRVNLMEQPGDNKSNEASSEAFTTTVSEEPQSTSLASLDFTSQANLAPASTTKDLNDSTTESPQSLSNATHSSENTTLTHGERNTNTSHFPWLTVVAVLLLFCSSLIAVGIRKWCQYQKEIMNRPPSFKPPPPPIKYTSMVESDGTAPSCHELENL
ncbi:T-cell surface protein tactile isoform X1 [Pitangus sulphuratus]|nr:T-cell surface protein tactile isoform X1 [Pitangus sulphuratus]